MVKGPAIEVKFGAGASPLQLALNVPSSGLPQAMLLECSCDVNFYSFLY